MKTLTTALAAAVAIVAVAGTALAAAQQQEKPSSTPPWQRDQPVYGSAHPAHATCTDMLKASHDEQTHLVAWLEGRTAGERNEKTDPNTYQPISVPAVMDFCGSNPKMTLNEAMIEVHSHHM